VRENYEAVTKMGRFGLEVTCNKVSNLFYVIRKPSIVG
jgi:hypothetical protein